MSDAPTPDPTPSATPSPEVAAPVTRQYEFTPDQDVLIADLASKMKFVGVFSLFVAILGLIRMVVVFVKTRDVLVDISAIVLVFVGLWTISAGKSFADVAQTRGRDITHLMLALNDLRNLYRLLYWLLIVALVLFVLLLIFVSAAAGGVQVSGG